jgi:hypothetical protein
LKREFRDAVYLQLKFGKARDGIPNEERLPSQSLLQNAIKQGNRIGLTVA